MLGVLGVAGLEGRPCPPLRCADEGLGVHPGPPSPSASVLRPPLCLQHGADATAVDTTGATPMDLAVEYECTM